MDEERSYLPNQGEEKKKKRNKFFDAFFYGNKVEDSLDDDIDESRGLKNYFKILGRYFGRIFTLNIYSVLGNFPVFFIMLALSENLHLQSTEPSSTLFGPLYGAINLGASDPVTSALFGIFGTQANVSIWTPWAWGFLIAGILMLLITFGPVNAGVTYNMRNIVKREPLFLWDDFKNTIKRNLKQSIIIGIMDLGIIFLLCYNVYFYYLNIGTYIFNVFFWFTLVMLVFYTFIRSYIYLLLVTFELSIFKIFKNALIFSLLGFGRNILALLVCAFIIAFNYALMSVYMPLGIILPFVITIALCLYTTVYTAWPKISKLMIEPYQN